MDDPARQVAEQLVAKYPQVDACVVVGMWYLFVVFVLYIFL